MGRISSRRGDGRDSLLTDLGARLNSWLVLCLVSNQNGQETVSIPVSTLTVFAAFGRLMWGGIDLVGHRISYTILCRIILRH